MVMYRDFAVRKARDMGVVGEVENKDDGTVFLVAEGEEDELLMFVKELQRGSFLSHVEHVNVSWQEPTGAFTDFHIRY